MSRVIQGSGIFFGILAGIYMPNFVLPDDTAFWVRMAVGLSIALATYLLLYRVGVTVGLALSARFPPKADTSDH